MARAHKQSSAIRSAKLAILFIFISLGGAQVCQAHDETIPFRLFRDYLVLVHCSVANHSGLTAIIDTGTTETIHDTDLARSLSLATWPDSATALNKDSAVQGVSIPNLQLGPLEIEKLDGITMDLSAIGRELGIHPNVVIGMDVLQRANFMIDYKSRVISFGPPQPMAHSAPIAPVLRFVLIDSTILGKPVRLQVDTGFNSLLLYGNSKNFGGFVRPVATRAKISGVTQASNVRSVDSPEVRIGNWHASHMPVAIMNDAPRDLTAFDGLLGPRLLGAQRVAFDFDHKMFYWD